MDAAKIRTAFYDAQKRRPYKANDELVKALTPPGGEWRVEAPEGAICRSVMWHATEVAHVNPSGALNDSTEGDIAMALRAMPLLDCALRSIIVLAESPDNLALIRDIAVSSVAFIEMPAPRLHAPDEDEDEDLRDVADHDPEYP